MIEKSEFNTAVTNNPLQESIVSINFMTKIMGADFLLYTFVEHSTLYKGIQLKIEYILLHFHFSKRNYNFYFNYSTFVFQVKI